MTITPNSFKITVGQKRPQATQRHSDTFTSDNVSLLTKNLNPRLISLKTYTDGFEIFIGEARDPNDQEEFQAAGTLLRYDEPNKRLLVECDRLGTSIIYWQRHGDSIELSNRLENLADGRSDPDWSSIQQYLHTGFTIQDTTFFKGIHQTEPNTRLQVLSTGHTIDLSVSDRAGQSAHCPESPQVLTQEIGDQLSKYLKSCPPSILMMSAGWDSRTLLIEKEANIVGAYSHGDLSSREITLTRKLSGNQRLDHLFTDVESCPISTGLIDQMLDELGFGVFPIWFAAARNIERWKNLPIMSGVLGELLGGHYGLMSWGSRLQKLVSSSLLINESFIRDRQIRSLVNRYATPPDTHWFISSQGQQLLNENRDETKRRCLGAIEERYKASGNWQRALEDFNMSHRARQYILKQAQAASSTVGYSIPFANEHLTDLVRALDFNLRVHNKANRQILKRDRPDLLREPLAATLIAAKYPILLQEASRIIRVLGETAMKTLGKPSPKLGWFNYEHLYKNETLHQITDSLKSDIWEKQRMHTALRKNPEEGIDAGSTLDMLCKIKTVDYHLNLANAKITPNLKK